MFKIGNRKYVIKGLQFFVFFILGFSFNSIYFGNTNSCLHNHEHELSLLEPSISKTNDILVVIIFSAPENYARRKMIRSTWLLTKGNLSIRHYFVIGYASLTGREKVALQNERSQFKDLMLLEKISDSFAKLSNKLLEAFRLIDKNSEFDFLLKVDDDSFVRLDALYDKMLNQPKEKLYWGFFDGRAHVKRKGKWRESNWFLCDRYLPYALGGGYVLTKDLVRLVVSLSEHLLLYKNEDVNLGTWLAPFDAKRVHDPQFDTEFSSRGCSNSYLVTHKQSTVMMLAKYNNLVKYKKLCKSEFKSRNSYVYNWSELPSQCCNRSDSNVP